MKCIFCGATASQPHDRSVEHGDPYQRTFTGNVAQCGCRWTRGPITMPDGSQVGFGDVLHECPLHRAASQARLGRPGQSGGLFTVNRRKTT